ncbi:hypothetical protein ACFT56_31165, partial [Streptomyces cinereoruber]
MPRGTEAAVENAVASGDAWRSLPPVQRVVDAPRTVAERGFAASLATHWNPSFRTDLGHGALPDAPAGVFLDAVRPVPPSSTELPGLRLPTTGRTDPAGAEEVRGGTAASGTGTGTGVISRAAAAPQGRGGDAARTGTGTGAADRAAAVPQGRVRDVARTSTDAVTGTATAPVTGPVGGSRAVQRAAAVPAGRNGTASAPVRDGAATAPVRGGGSARAAEASVPAPPARRAVTATGEPARSSRKATGGDAPRPVAAGAAPPGPVRRSPLTSARPVQP